MTATMKASKAAKAFQRKLLIAWLIDQHPGNLSHLQAITAMPRRTLQDCIKDLDDIGITCSFIQQEGAPNNQGEFKIDNWGPIELKWINGHIEQIAQSLEIDLSLPDS